MYRLIFAAICFLFATANDAYAWFGNPYNPLNFIGNNTVWQDVSPYSMKNQNKDREEKDKKKDDTKEEKKEDESKQEKK